jgi:hypothetical protein
MILQNISPQKLRHLRELPVLEELTLGCHYRLIASTVTDHCLAELVWLTSLKHLNLSQCVHVRDAGERQKLVCLGGAVCGARCRGLWKVAGQERVPAQ